MRTFSIFLLFVFFSKNLNFPFKKKKAAFNMYTSLFQKWQDRPQATGDPTNDCLGVARIIFCTYQYKFCDAEAQTDVF